MKFITITILFALIAYSLALNHNGFEDKWCGSSVVKVQIVTTMKGKHQITDAEITVPVSLPESDSHMRLDQKTNEQRFLTDKIIKKTQQGIIFNLKSADEYHKDRFYKQDEDSDNDIFIPYNFIVDIRKGQQYSSSNNFSIDLFLKKDFKTNIYDGEKTVVVTIQFLADKHNTNICPCMYNFFFQKILFNWNIRRNSLEYIRSQLFLQISTLYSNYKAISSIKDDDESDIRMEYMRKEETKQKTECSKIKIEIDMNLEEFNEIKLKQENTKEPDCDTYKEQLTIIEDTLGWEVKLLENDLKVQGRFKENDPVTLISAQSEVNRSKTHVINELSNIENNTDVLELERKLKLEAKSTQIRKIDFEISEVRKMEEIHTEVSNLKIFFQKFWEEGTPAK